MLRKFYLPSILCWALFVMLAGSGIASDMTIVNARLIDGTGGPPKSGYSIHIHDGYIAQIGANLPVGDGTLLDVGGATVMPGLIDSHVHLFSVPGATFRHDDEAALWRQRYHQLKAYLAVGVTTVLDCGIGAPALRQIQDYLSNGGVGPRVYALGPTFIPKDGYMDDLRLYAGNEAYRSQFPPAVASEQDVLALFEAFEGIPNIIGVKVYLERGMAFWDIWPIFTPEMLDIIQQEAAKRHLPIWVHAMDEDEQSIALTMNPRTIAHSGYMVGSPTIGHINDLARAGVYVNSTQMTANVALGEFHPEWYDTPLARLTVPQEQIATVKDPDAWEQFYTIAIDVMTPTNFGDPMKNFMYLMRRQADTSFKNFSIRALRRMYDRGIPIAMGSDGGDWPAIPNHFHGLSTIMELELMQEAGMALEDIIDSSTQIPAGMMGLSDKVGTIAVGKCADMIVLEGDPLTDIGAYRTLLWTIKDGVAKTPEEWMQEE